MAKLKAITTDLRKIAEKIKANIGRAMAFPVSSPVGDIEGPNPKFETKWNKLIVKEVKIGRINNGLFPMDAIFVSDEYGWYMFAGEVQLLQEYIDEKNPLAIAQAIFIFFNMEMTWDEFQEKTEKDKPKKNVRKGN